LILVVDKDHRFSLLTTSFFLQSISQTGIIKMPRIDLSAAIQDRQQPSLPLNIPRRRQ
jgi:hypothetical protein